MNSHRRPTFRNWRTGLLIGAALGTVLLGIGGRAGMRLIAMSEGRAPAFTIEGSIAVTLLGALTGAVIAAIFLLSRALAPGSRVIRSAFFWVITLGLTARGLSPLTYFSALIFGPLFILHAGIVNAYWCRVASQVPGRSPRAVQPG